MAHLNFQPYSSENAVSENNPFESRQERKRPPDPYLPGLIMLESLVPHSSGDTLWDVHQRSG